MATLIAVIFTALLTWALVVNLQKKKYEKKATNFKDGEIPKQNPK